MIIQQWTIMMMANASQPGLLWLWVWEWEWSCLVVKDSRSTKRMMLAQNIAFMTATRHLHMWWIQFAPLCDLYIFGDINNQHIGCCGRASLTQDAETFWQKLGQVNKLVFLVKVNMIEIMYINLVYWDCGQADPGRSCAQEAFWCMDAVGSPQLL